jgi:hypothetical protein
MVLLLFILVLGLSLFAQIGGPDQLYQSSFSPNCNSLAGRA